MSVLAQETEAEQREMERKLSVFDEMLTALRKIAQIQRDKCECADAEMLFMILDNKVDIALAAIAKAEGRS
jgi:hypothetical protein